MIILKIIVKEIGIQFGVFATEFIEHVLVGGAEVIDVGFSEGRSREFHVLSSPVRADVEPLSLEQRMGLHAPILIG